MRPTLPLELIQLLREDFMNKNFNDGNRTTDSSTKTPADSKTSLTDRIGNAVEGLGHKVSDMGMPSIGKKIHDLGDKIETDHDDPNHPHDV